MSWITNNYHQFYESSGAKSNVWKNVNINLEKIWDIGNYAAYFA